MTWQNSLFLLIPTIFLIVLIFPVLIEVRASYNPLFNKGVVALFVLKKQIFYFVVTFHGKYVELENQTETKRQELQFESQEFAVMEEFLKQIKDKIKLKKLFVFYNLGFGDAFESAYFCGLVNLILTQFFLYIKNQKPTASLCIYDTATYNKICAEFAVICSSSISLFDVAYSYIYSVIITRKVKN